MQRYNNLNECIQMCDRILRTNSYPREDVVNAVGVNPQQTEKFASDLMPFKPVGSFFPSRTIVVQNFLSEAEVHVRSFVAMFGIVEICELFKDEAPSCLAVVQYKTRRSAADALLAMPYCQVRGSNLVVNLLWNGPYEHISLITQSVSRSFQECAEKRVVCIGNLPRSITEEGIGLRCGTYGRVISVRVQPQEHGAFAYVVFQSALAAAVATYCLRNSSTSNAALMLGYGENANPVLLGPIRVRPLDQYAVPLTAFDVRSICTRFLDYSRLKGFLVNMHRKMPPHHFFRPGAPEYCVRIPATQVKGLSMYLELLLFEGDVTNSAEEITDMAYQLCSHKYLFRFTMDFGLHKPIMLHDDRTSRPNSHFLRWNSFFILDLQICIPWGFPEPRLEPRIQTMNHICSGAGFEDTWFGIPLRHSILNQSEDHLNKVRYIMSENLPFVRLVASSEDINSYQLPMHVYSEAPTNLKTS